MKKYLFLLLLIFTCGQQKKPPNDLDRLPSIDIQISTLSISVDSSAAYISMDEGDSSITIVGDTIKVIWMLFVNYQELSDKYYNCQRKIDSIETAYIIYRNRSQLKW